MNEVMRKQK